MVKYIVKKNKNNIYILYVFNEKNNIYNLKIKNIKYIYSVRK